jgi:hypothetical protein
MEALTVNYMVMLGDTTFGVLMANARFPSTIIFSHMPGSGEATGSHASSRSRLIDCGKVNALFEIS